MSLTAAFAAQWLGRVQSATDLPELARATALAEVDSALKLEAQNLAPVGGRAEDKSLIQDLIALVASLRSSYRSADHELLVRRSAALQATVIQNGTTALASYHVLAAQMATALAGVKAAHDAIMAISWQISRLEETGVRTRQQANALAVELLGSTDPTGPFKPSGRAPLHEVVQLPNAQGAPDFWVNN